MIFRRRNRDPLQDLTPRLQDTPDLSSWLRDSRSHELPMAGKRVLLLASHAEPLSAQLLEMQPATLEHITLDAVVDGLLAERDPDVRWDLVLIPAGLVERDDALDILGRVNARLANDGIIVLGALYSGRPGMLMSHEETEQGLRAIPTHDYVFHMLLRDYSYKQINFPVPETSGRSALRRAAVRCQLRKPVLLLIWGPPYHGKSSLLRDLERYGIPCVQGDRLVFEIMKRSEQPPALRWVSALKPSGTRLTVTDIYQAAERDDRQLESLVADLLNWLPRDIEMQALELMLSEPGVAVRTAEIVTRAGFFPWLINRGDQLDRSIPPPFRRPDKPG